MHVNRDRQDDMYHMANVLQIDSENFERALAISSLTSRDGSHQVCAVAENIWVIYAR